MKGNIPEFLMQKHPRENLYGTLEFMCLHFRFKIQKVVTFNGYILITHKLKLCGGIWK